ncbi:MAG: hypothetical protein R2822_13990 [Spirosomataceae bacterium]
MIVLSLITSKNDIHEKLDFIWDIGHSEHQLCSSKSDQMYPYSCASSQPILTGKWELVEFRYFGGCCPVIADSSWKKAEAGAYFVEFTTDKKLKVLNTTTNLK